MRTDNQDYFNGNAVTGSARLRDTILRLQMPKAEAVTIPVVRNKRGRPRKNTKPHAVNFGIIDVQARTAGYYQIPLVRLLASARHVKQRQVAMFLTRETGASLPEIGRHFGRDHTTVLYAIRAVAKTPALWADVISIRKKLRSPVYNVDKFQIVSKSRPEYGKEQIGNGQEELVA